MIVKSSKSLRAIAAVGAAAAVAACASEASDEGVVARVGPYRLMVDQAVELLVDQENLAAEARVVESLAELWIDYTLLAEAVYRDSLFSDLDLEPLVMQQVAQAMVFQLRDSVIQVDTFITEDELRVRYEAEAPAVEVRARHIMLQPPLQASQAQQDSVREVLAGLRERILGGESFEALAGQFSQDPGSARNGGDLGYFGRGDMVAPFEEAALALQPGEVSDVVTTPMGFHLIRLDERRVRGFEDVAAQYRLQVQARMVQ
jgi:parvulin-like peptidyl-prolyl isomerase